MPNYSLAARQKIATEYSHANDAAARARFAKSHGLKEATLAAWVDELKPGSKPGNGHAPVLPGLQPPPGLGEREAWRAVQSILAILGALNDAQRDRAIDSLSVLFPAVRGVP